MNKSHVSSSFENLSNKLGFGTSGLMGSAISDRGRVKLLDNVFAKGVRHFDTAPLYGQGEAERVVGKFLRGKRSQVSIASKFGLSPQRIPSFLKPIRPIARYVNRRLVPIQPYVKTLLESINRPTVSKNLTGDLARPTLPPLLPEMSLFKLECLESELNCSLKCLGVDYIDYYLFHECFELDISNALLETLNKFIAAGKIGSYGIATSQAETAKILRTHSEFRGVVQTTQSFDIIEATHNASAPLFVHSVFRDEMFQKIRHLSQQQDSVVEKILDELNLPIETISPEVSICLNAVLHNNDIEKMIFSSSNLKHIDQTINALDCNFKFSHMSAVTDLMA